MNAKKLFVIACYYDGSNKSIFECVNSIQKYYKSPQIAVIDSNSPDKSYFKKLKEKGVIVYNAKTGIMIPVLIGTHTINLKK